MHNASSLISGGEHSALGCRAFVHKCLRAGGGGVQTFRVLGALNTPKKTSNSEDQEVFTLGTKKELKRQTKTRAFSTDDNKSQASTVVAQLPTFMGGPPGREFGLRRSESEGEPTSWLVNNHHLLLVLHILPWFLGGGGWAKW